MFTPENFFLLRLSFPKINLRLTNSTRHAHFIFTQGLKPNLTDYLPEKAMTKSNFKTKKEIK